MRLLAAKSWVLTAIGVALREALVKLAASCKGDGPTSACPIPDALDKEGEYQ